MSIVDDAVAQDVRTYAAQVRAALTDLGPENVDDLTDGLEANLADALADDGRAHRGSLVDEFGEPAAYAAELRTAAGLAAASTGRRGGLRAALGAPGRELRDVAVRVLARVRGTRWFPGVEDLAVALRPAWWVLRGWALTHLVLQVLDAEPTGWFWLPSTLGGWVLLVLCVVASAQWGRGRWRTGRRWHRVLVLLSAFLAVAGVVLLLWLPAAAQQERQRMQWALDSRPSDGVLVDGEYSFNLFVYDAAGHPVEGAQIFDQAGRPVTTEPYGGVRWRQQSYWPDGATEPTYHVGVPGQNGQTRWNVFPLHSLTESGWAYDGETGVDVVGDEGHVVAPSWPFAAAAPVVPWGTTHDAPSSDAPSPSPSPSPTAGPPADADAATGPATGEPTPTDPPAATP